MNYIIFKNKDSRAIPGLLIQELPPITKPKMRQETTVIDGKDGDITDNLGYSAYDQQIKIGLTRGYDISEIIKYFSGSGTIIFSNEPDKYYMAEIIDQINFDRLLKFRIANVKIHMQPYKYLINESPAELEITTETELKVYNVGLEQSSPIFTLYGDGIVEISINGIAIFQINIDDEYVTVDSNMQECYKGNVLKNRKMVGEFINLEKGESTITWTGNLKKIIVEPKSRWL